MAVAVLDNPATGTTDHPINSSATNTLSFALSSGTNTALVALITFNDGGGAQTISSVVWDPTGVNQALTLITGTNNPGGSLATALYGLVNPTSGTKNLVATFSASVAGSYLAGISYTGVDQTGGATSFPHGTTNVGTSTTASSGSITSATGNMVVGTMAATNGVNSTSGTNVYRDNVTSAGGIFGGGNTDTGAATVTLTGTLAANSDWHYSACDIKAAVTTVVIGKLPPVLLLPPMRTMVGWRGLRNLQAFPPQGDTLVDNTRIFFM